MRRPRVLSHRTLLYIRNSDKEDSINRITINLSAGDEKRQKVEKQCSLVEYGVA